MKNEYFIVLGSLIDEDREVLEIYGNEYGINLHFCDNTEKLERYLLRQNRSLKGIVTVGYESQSIAEKLLEIVPFSEVGLISIEDKRFHSRAIYAIFGFLKNLRTKE
jgi:hypothetical protein